MLCNPQDEKNSFLSDPPPPETEKVGGCLDPLSPLPLHYSLLDVSITGQGTYNTSIDPKKGTLGNIMFYLYFFLTYRNQ